MTTQPTHSDSLEELRDTVLIQASIVQSPKYNDSDSLVKSVDNIMKAIDHYTTTKINEVLDAVEELCQEAEGVNLEHNGRPDCKNCSLLENLEDKLSQIKNTHKPKSESEESL